jgi:hypothetical protein
MVPRKTEGFPAVEGPIVELQVRPDALRKGGTVTLRWNVQRAEEARLFLSVETAASGWLNWGEIARLGESVPLEGTKELSVEETTGAYLVAHSALAQAGTRVRIEVQGAAAETAPFTCQPDGLIQAKMIFQPHLAPIGWVCIPALPLGEPVWPRWPRAGEEWNCCAAPSLSLTVGQAVIFQDESTTVNWQATNAAFANLGYHDQYSILLADASQIGATRQNGGGYGAGGWPGNGTPLSGSATCGGQPHFRFESWYLSATNAAGQAAGTSLWLDVLSVPQFKGMATAARQVNIRNAIRDILGKLRQGCILNDAALDQTVGAFQKKLLSRAEVWWRLVTALQNLVLITFDCQDVTSGAVGSWSTHSNDIILRWLPNGGPNLPYVILHELVHKVGFHSGLYSAFSGPEIESQCDTVASSCYP